MPAKKTTKKKITINRKPKPVEEVIEAKPEVVEEETPVTTVVEEEITTVVEPKVNNVPVRWEIVWNGMTTSVVAPKWRIRFEAQVAAVPMFKLPPDIRQYLINKWFGTNVWKRDKERLEKHWADMEMIEKLKKFLTGEL